MPSSSSPTDGISVSSSFSLTNPGDTPIILSNCLGNPMVNPLRKVTQQKKKSVKNNCWHHEAIREGKGHNEMACPSVTSARETSATGLPVRNGHAQNHGTGIGFRKK